MKNEIVKSYPPFAGFGIRRMMDLRMYIEHCLLARKLEDNQRHRSWILNPKDAIWQAVCRFYSLMLEVRIENHRDLENFADAVSRIAAGGLILGFDYPHEWDYIHVREALSSLAADEIIELISEHGMPQALDEGTSLPLTHFNEHLNITSPGEVIRFRRHSFRNHVNILVLNDGQFMSAAEDWAGEPSLSPDPEGAMSKGANPFADELALTAQFHMEKELCTRWLSDSVLGVPLRNVVSDEGTTIEPVPTLERLLPHYLETNEHLYRVIAAASPDGAGWPVKLCEPVFARLRDRSLKDPQGVDCFLRLLSPAQRSILPSELLARML